MEQLKIGIVICSRKESSRVKHKPFKLIADKPALAHLIDRLAPSDIPIFVAVPVGELGDFHKHALSACEDTRPVFMETGDPYCPLRRMCKVAIDNGMDAVIRVTHDKILVDPELLKEAVHEFTLQRAEYLYSSWLPAGCGFEIIATNLLKKAVALDPPFTEHISYAVRALNPKTIDLRPRLAFQYQSKQRARFLLDYDADFQFLTSLFHLATSTTISVPEAIKLADQHPHLNRLNRLPDVSVYTCAHNEAPYIQRAIDSVFSQTGVSFEYLIVDDASTDNTLERVISSPRFPQLTVVQNHRNMGLASSCNRVLDIARGDYLLRLDADDVFIFPDAVASLFEYATVEGADLVYPSYVDQRGGSILDGRHCHHAGGALFKKAAVNYVRFTDGLRGYDGYDFFKRAHEETTIKYYQTKPLFFYTHRENSLSSESEYRSLIKQQIDAGHTGTALLKG